MTMIPLVPLFIALIAAFFWGVHDYFQGGEDDGSGWIYFISNGEGTPVKVGMSRYDPDEERLPDLQTGSPTMLHVLYKFQVSDRQRSERTIHQHLVQHKVHGEWYDRDATLAFISYLKGAYSG
jgi:hypothetical protein